MELEIFKKINISISGCHEWLGALEKDAYGMITYEGKRQRVHRLLMKLMVFDIKGKVICHKCDMS